jgi:hypothetical protein
MRRRRFLERVGGGALASLAAAGKAAPEEAAGLVIVLDPADPVASAAPARSAADLLRRACEARGLPARLLRSAGDSRPDELRVLARGSAAAPESFALVPKGARELLATAPDPRGLAYALCELADRVSHADGDARSALRLAAPQLERPRCRIRGVMRPFVSEVEDTGWFHDRAFWKSYLAMLVTQRFNRFNLALGIGYDFARQLRDTYFYFAYPFLLAVPGHDVRVRGLADAERDKNLETLRFVSDEAVAHGLHFQLGLWTHAYEWIDSPNANYTIEGLAPATHAAYCRDALRALLEACPSIGGVTIRSHGESGVSEADPERAAFWRAIFDGVARAGRAVEIDLHAKGIDQGIIDMALATGVTVRVSPKFWAEHMGLPYLQSSIRELELPRLDASGLMALSTGSRNHMRYSYGDLFVKGRRYGILHRVWPGTQRLLLWGDPAFAAQLGWSFSALGADGVEFFEPLSFKGRKGSGLAGGRHAYADASLRPAGGDWEKYLYTYRLWGRLAFDPDADRESWRRQLRTDFGAAAPAVESGLARASRILPLITTAHCPSAANNNYWPELYTNMSLCDASRPGSFSDTPSPKLFGFVTSLDPQLFASVDEHARALLAGRLPGKVSPVEVAQQLERWAAASAGDLAQADAKIARREDPAYRRLRIDCAIAAATGRFFASKLRAGVLFAIFDETGDARARTEALAQYRQARAVWAELAAGPATAYARDISFGYDAHLRGHWLDRLAAIDRDIAALEAYAPQRRGEGAAAAIAAVLRPPVVPRLRIEHTPKTSFRPGAPLPIEASAGSDVSVRLWYRHMNQAESYQSLEMRRDEGRVRSEIPAGYTDSPYALQYYFEARSSSSAALSPGFGSDFLQRPYFVTEPV